MIKASSLRLLGPLTVAVSLLSVTGASFGIPIIAVDLDPFQDGIQSNRTVTLDDEFLVDVVYLGDGTSPVDAMTVDIAFNNSGNVLAPGNGNGDPRAGILADGAIDVNGLNFLSFQDPIVLLPTAAPPTFDETLGGILLGWFPELGDSASGTVFSLAFVADNLGTSLIAPIPVEPPPSDPVLAFFNNPVAVDLQGATISVIPPGTVPLPTTWTLMALGLVAMLRRR